MTSDELRDVDVDLLADYIGGVLDGPDAAAVARLIADDPRWGETYDLLVPGMIEVGARLQVFGARPEPMPADVAARLDAALTAPPADAGTRRDAALTASAADHPVLVPAALHVVPGSDGQSPDATDREDPPPLTTGRDDPPHLTSGGGPLDETPGRDGQRRLHVVSAPAADRPARRRSRRLRWAAPIAAAAGVLAFAGVGIDLLADGSEDATSTAGGSREATPMMGSPSLATAPPADRIVTSGADYTEPTLGTDPVGLMAASESQPRTDRRSSASAAEGVLSADPLARLRLPDALLACLEAIAREHGGTPIDVRTVDYARFGGAPALVVQFVADGVTWGWASGPACGAPGRGADSLQQRRVG